MGVGLSPSIAGTVFCVCNPRPAWKVKFHGGKDSASVRKLVSGTILRPIKYSGEDETGACSSGRTALLGVSGVAGESLKEEDAVD